MDVIRLGPLVLPMQAALALAALLAANGVAAWLHRRRGVDAAPVLWKMTVTGFVVARLLFVLRHHDLYGAAPWTALDFRDGGFDGLAGLIAACVVGAELTRRHAPLRKPLLAATVAGCALWFGGTALNQALTPAGAPLPAVEVRRMDASPVALRSFVGRPLVVNLWATWCPPCRREMPVLQAAQRAHPDIGFVFVNQGEPAKVVAPFLATHGPLDNVLLDPARQLGTRTDSFGYPTTLFYDAKGRLRLRHVGELSAATLREKLDLLRAGR